MLKKIVLCLFAILLVTMAVATFVEHSHCEISVYSSWWFLALWSMAVLAACIYSFPRFGKKVSLWSVHMSFLVILLGALITYFSASRGTLHLLPHDTTILYEDETGLVKEMPISIRLDSFEVLYYKESRIPKDYISQVTVLDKGGKSVKAKISMNHIFKYGSLRFYQLSYDPLSGSSVLFINKDPWGIGVTYIGYALLFLSLFFIVVQKWPQRWYRAVLIGLFLMWLILIYVFDGPYMETHCVMPVLRTPWFGIHVGLMIIGYSLSAILFILALISFIRMMMHRSIKSITSISRKLLLPAVAFSVAGIFVGAIWANVSWGKYWGWDAKETWALVAFLFYCAPLHTESIKIMRKSWFYHLWMIIGFAIILFTYFGGNYYLAGMHSYV